MRVPTPYRPRTHSYRPIPALVLGLGLLLLAASCSYSPLQSQLDPLGVRISETDDYIELTPSTGSSADTGIMFWPGGLVDPHSYRGSLGVLAARGYRIVIVKVPLNLAVLARQKGLKLAEQLGGSWIASGHSLGGAMAASTLHDTPDGFAALILMAAYPPDDKSLADWDSPVLSLSAEHDGLADPDTIASKKPLLPDHTEYYQIEGGNHAQFGAYGEQDDDGTATISAQEQYRIMADAIEEFMDTNSNSRYRYKSGQ